jgi:hypothetical protein
MLTAYDDGGFTIKDYPGDDTRGGPYPIESVSKAKDILAWAKKERPAVRWRLEGLHDGKGPYRVCEGL